MTPTGKSLTMTPIPASSLPDYDRLATEFDRFLPLVHPVTLALLEHLPVPADGATVLDVACGTGEPGLTLARRVPGVQLLGVDAAPGMVAVARSKAARETLANARFEVAPAEALPLADGGADAVLSRFGLLMFGEVAACARELARVLRPGGHFSLAVWDDMTKNTLVHTAFLAIRDHLPPELMPPFEHLNKLAAEGLRTGLLRDVGLGVVESEMFSWTMNFGSFDALWEFVAGPGVFQRQFATLTPAGGAQARRDLEERLAPYRDATGAYGLPHACRLLWGKH